MAGAGGREPLLVEQPLRHRPALVLLADHVLGRELDVVEELRAEVAVDAGDRRIGSMVRPGVPFSGTAIVDSPRCFGTSQSVRARHRP